MIYFVLFGVYVGKIGAECDSRQEVKVKEPSLMLGMLCSKHSKLAARAHGTSGAVLCTTIMNKARRQSTEGRHRGPATTGMRLGKDISFVPVVHIVYTESPTRQKRHEFQQLNHVQTPAMSQQADHYKSNASQ
eukprot:6463952-Amphidinium_carterae.2